MIDEQQAKKIHELLNFKNSTLPNELAKDEKALLIQKIANNSSAQEFQDFIVNHELPSTKLTASEMEIIKGGYSNPKEWFNELMDAFYKWARS